MEMKKPEANKTNGKHDFCAPCFWLALVSQCVAPVAGASDVEVACSPPSNVLELPPMISHVYCLVMCHTVLPQWGLMDGEEAFQSDLLTRPLVHCKVHNTPHLVEVVSSELVAVTEERAEERNQTNLREVGAT
jgi:hypothetical protein